MPYTGISDPNLPSNVVKLSKEKRHQWVAIFNDILRGCEKKGGADCEGKAFRTANGFVKGEKEAQMGDTEGQKELVTSAEAREGIVDRPPPPYGGAVSWQGADKYTDAMHDEGLVSSQLWAFNSLVANVNGDPEITAGEKAVLIKALADELPARVENPPEYKEFTGEKDASWTERAKTFLFARSDKAAVTRTEDGKKFSVGDYAYAPDKEKPSTWKLRLTEEPGKLTVAQVARAVTALQPGGFRGQVVQIPSADRSGVLSRISAAVDKIPGVTDDQKKKLQDRLDTVGGTKVASGFKVFKDPEGRTRWLAFSSNAFEDREKEIFSTKALEAAVELADKTGDRGPLRVYHVPAMGIGACDFQAVAGRFLVESGTFLPTKFGRAAEKYFSETDEPWEISIGYLFRPGDPAGGVYSWCKVFERSVIPAGEAANPWTQFAVIGGSMDEKRRRAAEMVFGEDLAKEVIDMAESQTKALEAQVAYKAADDADDAVKALKTLIGKVEDDDLKGQLNKALAALVPVGGKKDLDAGEETKAEVVGTPATQVKEGEGSEDKEDKKKEPVAVAAKSAGDATDALAALKQAITEAVTPVVDGLKLVQTDVTAVKERQDTLEQGLKEVRRTDDDRVASLFKPVSVPTGETPTTSVKNQVDVKEAKEVVDKQDGDDSVRQNPAGPYITDIARRVGLRL